MGQDLTLDHIEHEILRKEFNEPRIHMALVCAALSCPFLNQEPYEGARLDQQLDDQDSNFLSGGSYRVRYLDYDWTLNDRIYQ